MRDLIQDVRSRALATPQNQENAAGRDVKEAVKCGALGLVFLLFLLSALLYDSPGNIAKGLWTLMTSPAILVTDYMALGGPGAAFANSALLMLIALVIAKLLGSPITGPLLATFFTLGGYGMYGKNLLNIWPLMLGVFLCARAKGVKALSLLPLAFFSTSLSPLVSHLAFGFGWPPALALPVALVIGLMVGFVLPLLSDHFFKFHQGFSLYSMGFLAGVVGLMVMSLLRSFDFHINKRANLVAQCFGRQILIHYLALFLLIGLMGWLLSPNLWASLKKMLREPGQAPSDFVTRYGFGPVLVNMALLAFMMMLYVLISGGRFSGATAGALMAAVSFAGFGKHLRNCWPLMAGILAVTWLGIWPGDDAMITMAALYATTLAPVAGTFGWLTGFLTGILQIAVVVNLGYLHGFTNLYNNGFSAGFVAAFMVPMLKSGLFGRFIKQKN